jgi:polyphosphate kinase 2 (PPK2 family)
VNRTEPEAIGWRRRTARSAARDTKALRELQAGLCALQDWIRQEGGRMVVVFEGRDAARAPIETHALDAFAQSRSLLRFR